MATMKRNDRLDRYFDGIEMEKWLPTIGYDEDSEDGKMPTMWRPKNTERKEAQGWA